MSVLALLVAGLFVPLFPLSMPFNRFYATLKNQKLRALMLLAWPQIGLVIISKFVSTIPFWFPDWALFTSILYAVRALVLRELGLWTSFISTSVWALLWILLDNGVSGLQLHFICLGLSVPLLLMSFLVAELEKDYGAAYLGLYGGLAQSQPRLTIVLVLVVLAIMATPLFPGFFVMLSMVIQAIPAAPGIALGVGVVWLLWSWAGARLLQNLIVGEGRRGVIDLRPGSMWLFWGALSGLMLAGVYWIGATL